MTSQGGSLRALSPRGIYFLPDAEFVDDILIGGLQRAQAFDAMVGYFASSSLADLAPGLAAYLGRDTAAVRLVISPQVSEADMKALEEGTRTPVALIESQLLEAVGSTDVSSDALAQHTLLCLAYLLSKGRLTIKVALAPAGIFHPKVWLLTKEGDVLAAHGSSNMTGPGITGNIEQLSVARSWGDPREQEVVDDLLGFFSSMWSGAGTKRYPVVAVFDLPEAVRLELLKKAPKAPPSPDDFERIRGAVRPPTRAPLKRRDQSFRLPDGLELDTGPFRHQGQAIGRWEAAGRRGILSMATGSGKTITSLAAAVRAATAEKRLLLVIAAPQLPLLSMWASESRLFGIEPTLLARGSMSQKLKRLEGAVRRLDLGATSLEIVIVTHDLLVGPHFQAILARSRTPAMLIGDEVHRLGRPEFLNRVPEFFKFRLGLSATPERQFDPEGTAALESFFGPQVFEFGLRDAIGVCLVPFDYYVHLVQLDADELADWQKLSDKVSRIARGAKDDPELERQLKLLLIRRRRILERARQKVPAFSAEVLRIGKSMRRTLAYATDKDPQQLMRVNEVLQSHGLTYHQVTAAETSSGLAEEILESFRRGQLQVLTAKRVLDEGINVPAIRSAYVLASTTVRRQWVQRLGRVLRLDPESGKEYAEYHDFIALPTPEQGRDDQARRMLREELSRIRFFGDHARNQSAAEGWLQAANFITDEYFA